MIGFKTTEDYSLDECIVYLTEHNDKDSLWEEINQRYHNLLSQLHKEDEFSQPVIFLNNLIFKMQNKGHQEAIEYINSEKNNLDMTIVFEYLNGEKHIMGGYGYFRPNKDGVTSLLNEAEVYEYVEIEYPDDWAATTDEIAVTNEDVAE